MEFGTGVLKLVNYRLGVEDCSRGANKPIFAVDNCAYGVRNRVYGVGNCSQDVRNLLFGVDQLHVRSSGLLA
ncbi:MAG: hypothetical protein ACM3YE_09480 [Bacteroidota bacterium]